MKIRRDLCCPKLCALDIKVAVGANRGRPTPASAVGAVVVDVDTGNVTRSGLRRRDVRGARSLQHAIEVNLETARGPYEAEVVKACGEARHDDIAIIACALTD